MPFSVIGTDYAGPFIYKTKRKRDIKVDLLLLTCSLTRAAHLEILPNQTTQDFIQALKQLIARRGRLKVIYSDNAKMPEKASKWIKSVYKHEGMQEFLGKEQVKWKFNLCKVSWWGRWGSKAMFIKINWEIKTLKAGGTRSHTGHRDKLKQSTR